MGLVKFPYLLQLEEPYEEVDGMPIVAQIIGIEMEADDLQNILDEHKRKTNE